MDQGRSDKRRKGLMKAAAVLFLRHGYEGVTVDDIVKRAGGSKSTVYQAFGGKCGLFITSIEGLCEEFNEPLQDLDYAGLGLEASLLKFGNALVALIGRREYLALHRLIIAEAARCPELGLAWHTHGPAKTMQCLVAVLRLHPGAERVRAVHLQRAAVLLHDALVGDPQRRLLSGVDGRVDARSIGAHVEQTVRLFLRGYEARR